ncbi:MAG: ankyrin repeat domain-containing protein [Pseudomonadota bacterium]
MPTLPPALTHLEHLAAQPEGPWPWDLELVEGDSDVLKTWTVADERRSFLRFAATSAGCELGLWATTGQPLEQAPVVYLDADGSENRVLARNAEEFLLILAFGQPDPAALGKVPDEAREALEAYRAWLADTVGLSLPKGKPAAIMKKSEAEHPGLQEWLEGEVAGGHGAAAVDFMALVNGNDAGGLRAALEAGVSWDDPDLKQAVSRAIFKDRGAILDLLLAGGMPVELKLAYGNTPLLEAAASGRVALVERLLAAGADPKAKNASREGAAALISEFNAPLRRKLAKLLGV